MSVVVVAVEELVEADKARELPSLQQLSGDDEVFVRSMLALAETGDMVRGRYVEAHIARLLGADFPIFGISNWDLIVPGNPPILVQVKSTRDSRFSLKGFFNGDGSVWVFVKLDPDKGVRPSTYSYAVAGPAERKRLRGTFGKTVSWKKLFEISGLEISADNLPSEVRRRARNR